MPDVSGYKKDVFGSYIDKDPAAILDYTVDWSEWLPLGATILDSTFAVSTIPGDTQPLSVVTDSVVGGQCIVELSGGTAGNIYTVTNTIETSDGQTDRRRFRIRAVERFL
jgi:hypothetical protein